MKTGHLNNKRIAIVGFGREGRGLASFFLARKIPFTILDNSEKISIPNGVASVLGENYLEGLESYDIVFRSPGIKLSLPEFVTAAKSGTQITSATQLFFDLCPCLIIGITGTKGKGTTSSLVAELLEASGQQVFLGGNIGQPAINFLDKLDEASKVVLELSSFQLQDLKKSPRYACVLNLFSDHLDYHKDLNEYRQSKLSIIRFQSPNDAVVLGADDENIKAMATHTAAKKYWFSLTHAAEPGAYLLEGDLYLNLDGKAQKICSKHELPLRGDHNVSNVLAAAVLAGLLGVKITILKKVVKHFSGMPHHHLEFCGKVDNVSFYNDSSATIPEAAAAALAAFNDNKILILGGVDKGMRYEQLARQIAAAKVSGVVAVGQAADKIRQALKTAGYKGKVENGGNIMSDIVHVAFKLSQPGDVVLLSPAAASFDMFKDYEDRGKQFKQAVKNLANNAQSRKT